MTLTLRAGLHYLIVSPYRAHMRSAHAQPLMSEIHETVTDVIAGFQWKDVQKVDIELLLLICIADLLDNVVHPAFIADNVDGDTQAADFVGDPTIGNHVVRFRAEIPRFPDGHAIDQIGHSFYKSRELVGAKDASDHHLHSTHESTISGRWRASSIGPLSFWLLYSWRMRARFTSRPSRFSSAEWCSDLAILGFSPGGNVVQASGNTVRISFDLSAAYSFM